MWLQLFFSFTEQMNNKLKKKKKKVVVVLLFFLLRCQKFKFSKEKQ